jgi:hypothetical protein
MLAGNTAINSATSPHEAALRVKKAQAAKDFTSAAHTHHCNVPRNVRRHDSQVGFGLDEMQRTRNHVEDRGKRHADPLRRGQDSQTGHG